jgi:hypothetical protein
MGSRRARLAVAAALLAAFSALIAARRPDVLLRPQFYAEDGMVWYANAHNWAAGGLTAIFVPYGGYLQVFPRLAAVVAQLVGLAAAPLLLNAIALLVQAVAPVFLLSDRFERALPGRHRRLLLSFLLVAVPNMMEIHGNVTNSQVHLALLALLVLLAEPASSAAWRAFDVGCLVISGVSGPFCVLLLPIAALCWLRERARWSLVRLLVVGAVALVQASVLVRRGPMHRVAAVVGAYGASPTSLLDLVGSQIFVAGLGGVWSYASLREGLFARQPWLPVLIGALGLVLLVRALLLTRSFALRVLLLFAVLHFSAGLTTPIIFGDKPVWELLKTPGAGQRYYYFATLAMIVTLLWMVAADPRRALRGVAAALLAVLLLVGVRRDWRLPPHPDLGFAAQAQRYADAAPGQKVSLRITPEPWTMELVKR